MSACLRARLSKRNVLQRRDREGAHPAANIATPSDGKTDEGVAIFPCPLAYARGSVNAMCYRGGTVRERTRQRISQLPLTGRLTRELQYFRVRLLTRAAQ